MAVELRERLDGVERQQDRFDERLKHVERTTDKTAKGVEQLLDREIHRPSATNWRSVLMVGLALMSGIASLALFVWWFVSVSPAFTSVASRVNVLEYNERASKVEIEDRTRSRWTSEADLIQCLQSEIVNRHMGFICTHPKRGIPYPEFRPSIPTG
jgi:hypothetical protein